MKKKGKNKPPPRELNELEWKRAEVKGLADRVAELDAEFNARALEQLATFRRALKRSGF